MAAPRCDNSGLVMALVLVLVMASGVSAQSTGNCNSAAETLTPCIKYVAGTDTSPNLLCCAALNILSTNTPDCLCQVATQLNAYSTVNLTKVYALPGACGLTFDATNCPAALSPGSSIAAPPSILGLSPPPPAVATPPSPSGNDAAGLRPSASAAFSISTLFFVLEIWGVQVWVF